MARVALLAGHDVIIPQLVARPELVLQLEQLAADVGVPFVEVALVANKNDVRRWFADRSAHPTSSTHRDAGTLISQRGGADALDRLHDDLGALLAVRPCTRRIIARSGDVDSTLRALEIELTLAASGTPPADR